MTTAPFLHLGAPTDTCSYCKRYGALAWPDAADPFWKTPGHEKPKELFFGTPPAFELEPLDPADPINILKRVRKCRDEVYEHFARDDGYLLESPDGTRRSLTYSTREGVDYQLTFWGADGVPTGHLDFNDFDEAAREIGCNGRRVPKGEW